MLHENESHQRGDHVDVNGILKPNVDAHDFEPSPGDIAGGTIALTATAIFVVSAAVRRALGQR